MPSRKARRHELDRQAAFQKHIDQGLSLAGYTLQGIDFTGHDLEAIDLEGVYLLGCHFEDAEQVMTAHEQGAFVFPDFNGLPYEPYRHGLYTVDELLEGWESGGYCATRDFRIYAHFDRARSAPVSMNIREALAQRLHDHGIDDALEEFLLAHRGRGVVGIMGGHSTRRDDPYYRKVVEIAWRLTREGYLVASGGGPGIMEAANLGAYLAHFESLDVIDAAVEVLAQHPEYNGGHAEGTPAYLAAIENYVTVAREVAARFGHAAPDEIAKRFGADGDGPRQSLAIPTWFYGHEPTNLFSDNVAKYFANSIREDGLLGISDAGVVFAPGSAGTLQEVFMDLAQNHYATFKARSPMVFLGSDTFHDTFALIERFIEKKEMSEIYGDMVTLVESVDSVITFIEEHPPRPRPHTRPLYEIVD